MFITLPVAIAIGIGAAALGSAGIVVAFVLGAKLGPRTPAPPQPS